MVQIQVHGFEGPIELLLDLIDRRELSITTVSLAEVTDQYWAELEGNGEIDPDTLADFITVGSKLMYLKSSALLPGAEPPPGDLDEKIEQTAADLTLALEEHKRFRDAVELFRQLEEEGRRTFARAVPPKNVPLPPGLEGVTLDNLLSAVKEALASRPVEEAEEQVIHIEPVTVNEKIEEISTAITRKGGRHRFKPLLQACKTRTEIVVLFLAVLELIKGGGLWAEQQEAFGDIELYDTALEAEEPEREPAKT
ncbi:MAG TPA: ScpA family protein [Dehalococcoidia bacterium]|nr:ScpA family protein [Dehalococcoidia bacterium]